MVQQRNKDQTQRKLHQHFMNIQKKLVQQQKDEENSKQPIKKTIIPVEK